MTALQTLYNKVLDNKVGKVTFLNECRRIHSNIFSNHQPFDEIVRVLVQKRFLKEHLTKDYVSQHEYHLGYEAECLKGTNPEIMEETILKNITKDRTHYSNLLSEKSVLNENKNLSKGSFVKMIKEELSKRKIVRESFESQEPQNSMEDSIFEQETFKNNQPDYEFYCVLGGKIVAGNEYKEDAIDFKNEYVHKQIKVYSKRFLVSKGINPDENKYWGSNADLAEVKTNLFEEQQDPFQEEFKSPQETSPELQKLSRDIQTAIANNKEFKGLYDSAYSFAEQKDDTWRGLMDTLARKLYNYLATVKTYVDNVTKGDMNPIVNILTTSTTLNENRKLKLVNLFKK